MKLLAPAQLAFHKKRGAIRLNVFLPKVETTPAKEGGKTYSKQVPGAVWIEGAAAIEGQTRAYNWQTGKVDMALNQDEIAAIIDLKEGKTCEFIHDPKKGTPGEEGKTIKSLKIARWTPKDPAPGQKALEPGWAFNLAVKEGDKSSQAGVILNDAQMASVKLYLTHAYGIVMGFPSGQVQE